MGTEWKDLLSMLHVLSFERRKVTLSSGRESDFFIDCKQTVLTAKGHALVGRIILSVVRGLPDRVCAVAGVELGGCPLASAVSQASFLIPRVNIERRLMAFATTEEPDPINAVYIRKDAKDHGSKRLLEGDNQLFQGARVVVLEDVITTGGSTLKAVKKLQDAGYVVSDVIVLVDRLEGGRQAIEATGLRVHSIYTAKDFR